MSEIQTLSKSLQCHKRSCGLVEKEEGLRNETCCIQGWVDVRGLSRRLVTGDSVGRTLATDDSFKLGHLVVVDAAAHASKRIPRIPQTSTVIDRLSGTYKVGRSCCESSRILTATPRDGSCIGNPPVFLSDGLHGGGMP